MILSSYHRNDGKIWGILIIRVVPCRSAGSFTAASIVLRWCFVLNLLWPADVPFPNVEIVVPETSMVE